MITADLYAALVNIAIHVLTKSDTAARAECRQSLLAHRDAILRAD
jgi:hypothetical protein